MARVDGRIVIGVRRGWEETMKRPECVLHVLKYYRPRFTGEGAFMERCIGFMQMLAPEVEHELLVTATPEPSKLPQVCSTLSRIHYLSRRPRTDWRHELRLLAWFVRNLHRYDTVHVRTHADWFFLSYLATKLARRRLVLSSTLDDSVPVLTSRYRRAKRPLVARLFRLFDDVISVSPRLHQETGTIMPAERCHMVPYGIIFPDSDPGARDRMRARLGIPRDALVLIFVGVLNRRKDPLLLARNLPAILRDYNETRLLLVGPAVDPAYLAEIEATIDEHSLRDRVIFTGEVPDPHPYFQAADIMTFGSFREGFGMVVPEAQANGLPVVVRRLPGVNDLFVKNGETGFFFDDDAGYAKALLRLAGDPALRTEVGRRAANYVRMTFDMPDVARRYLEIYRVPKGGIRDGIAPSKREWEELRQLGSSASIVNARLHSPAHLEAGTPPLIVTLIDAEETFDWTHQPFSRASADVRSMSQQFLAHRIFDRYGVVPTYMIDYPVATQSDGCGPLRELLADARCDIGAQLHAWVTPPLTEELTARNSYPGNLPVALEYQKIDTLTKAIEDGLKMRPQIYRAGRFGAGPRTGDILRRLGYLADSSVMPGWSFARQGGPDFMHACAAPYWTDPERTLLELPSTAGFVGRLADAGEKLRRIQFSRWSEAFYGPALMARLGLLERIRLTPEGILIEEAKRLVRYMLNRGHRVFVLTYHTPSLLPGCTPYVRTQQDLTRFLDWLNEFYDFFTGELHGRPATWGEVHERLLPRICAEPIRPAVIAA
jgi:glycosyltransferase involved in cell wall biosynthesis